MRNWLKYIVAKEVALRNVYGSSSGCGQRGPLPLGWTT